MIATRLNPETTLSSKDYAKKLQEEIDSNNKRISDLSVFVESLKAYEKETRILMDRNTGLMTVINSINSNIMKSVDEAALNAPPLTIDMSKFRVGANTCRGGFIKDLDKITTQAGNLNTADAMYRNGAIRP